MRICLLLLIASLLAGCDHEEFIREYDAPQDEPPPTQADPATAPASQPAVAQTMPGLTWTLPQGWIAQPAQQMRPVWFKASTEAGDVEIITSRLGGAFGSMRANVNRWRGMADLPPLDESAELPKPDNMTIAGAQASVYDFAGEGEKAKRVRVVILPHPGGELTYFFRAQGPAAAVTQQQLSFDGFVQSIRFTK